MGTNNLGFDDDFMATMLGDFLDESQGYLSNLNDNLLTVEELVNADADAGNLEVDLDLLNEMFRDAHSLKGLSAMLQLSDINGLTHKIENVFDAARDRSLSVDRNVVDLMFQSLDHLADMVEILKDPTRDEVEFGAVVEGIEQLLEGAGANKTQGSAESVEKAMEEIQAETPSAQAETPSAPPVPVDEPDPLADATDESEIPDKYLSIFIDETEESLDTLIEILVGDGEKEVDPVLVVCHRIKGSAASIGLNRAAKLTHLMEDLLHDLRLKAEMITQDISDALMFAADELRAYNHRLKAGEQGEDQFGKAYQALRAVQLGTAVQTASAPTGQDDTTAVAAPTCLTEPEREQLAAAAPGGAPALTGLVVFELGLPLAEFKAQLVCERLDELGDLFHCVPDKAQLESANGCEKLVFGLVTERTNEEVRGLIDVEGVERIELEAVATKSEKAKTDASSPLPSDEPVKPSPASREPAEQANKNRPTETLRVDIERFDHLMNLAGELVINKSRFGQIGEEFKGLMARKQSATCLANISGALDRILGDTGDLIDCPSNTGAALQEIQSYVRQIQRDLEVVQVDFDQLSHARTLVNDLGDAVHQLDRVSDGIQKTVMDTRMVPIGPLFGRFKRVIRDITRSNGKSIKLSIRGDKTELDKRTIDELGDPLIHMVRNSADHGVESPEERLAAGKPEEGNVVLDAFHRGNRIFIQVQDDGKGLDPEKLKIKAIEKGIITEQDADRLTRQQALQLIWEPGFSTAEKITEVSGRGMGMDIVRSKIESLSGIIELDSELGVGTTITIKLPLTMAILPSLLSVISGDVFAVPMESVSEIVSVTEKDMKTVLGVSTARIRGRVISVVELNELLRCDHQSSTTRVCGERTLVIVGIEGRELGLVVDDLLGEEDIVIKSLAENYRNVPGIAGASILGDGRVSLILDVAALVDMAGELGEANGTDETLMQENAKSEMAMSS